MSHERMIGYCTNVHAGTDIEQIKTNLDQISVPVRERLGRKSMGVGLWIPAEAADELTDGQASAAFRDWLFARGLTPFTINGFPYGNFHQPVVKHRVYQPTWWEQSRRDYTLKLADILNQILPPEVDGSISTLPLGWPDPKPTEDQMAQAASNLTSVADRLAQIEEHSGRRITIAIEPEPGCVIDLTDDMIGFFDRYIPNPKHRRYLTVCHDVCHAAVMHEGQAEVLRKYADAGLGVGKIQVSSAIDVRWREMDSASRDKAMTQLTEFAEDKYLHQTTVVRADGSHDFVEDLPLLVNGLGADVTDQSWRIHFHVPIYLDHFGMLHATRDSVVECLQAARDTEGLDFSGHLEAETYAWGVLPKDLSVDNLADGIARELQWLYDQVNDEEMQRG